MKTGIELEVKPLEVPYYVRVLTPTVPGKDSQEFPMPVELVDAATLKRLCDDLRAAVFKQAKKSPPPLVMYRPEISVSSMVDRFLSWRLPQNFAPDCGISFTPVQHPNSWPIGTNLLTADQARAMIEHVIAPYL